MKWLMNSRIGKKTTTSYVALLTVFVLLAGLVPAWPGQAVYGKASSGSESVLQKDGAKKSSAEQNSLYLNRAKWKITASLSSEDIANMIDGNAATRWSTGKPQTPGDWIEIDLGQEERFDVLFMDSGKSKGDYAYGYAVYVSQDGKTWSEPVANGKGTAPSLVVSLKEQKKRYVKIVLTASSDKWWSIADLNIGIIGKPASDGSDQEKEPVKPEDPSKEAPETENGTLKDRSRWKISASSSQEDGKIANMVDGNAHTRWTTGKKQTGGQWLMIDLGQKESFDYIALDQSKSPNDYPQAYKVYVSNDRKSWGEAIAAGKGEPKLTSITFPKQVAQYIRIVQTGEGANWWSISDLRISDYGLGKQKQLEPEEWTVTASSGKQPDAVLLEDDTRWTSGKEQAGGEWIQLDLGEAQTVGRIVMDSAHHREDYARGYEVYVSSDGKTWGDPVAAGKGTSAVVEAAFPLQTVRYIQIKQTGNGAKWWSITNLTLFTSDATANPGHGSEEPQALDRFGWTATASLGKEMAAKSDSSKEKDGKKDTSKSDSSKEKDGKKETPKSDPSKEKAGKDASALIDGDLHTRWTTETSQQPGQWIQLDLGSVQSFSSIRMDSRGSDNDYARGYEVLVSGDGDKWTIAAKGTGVSSVILVEFPEQSARYVKIVQTESTAKYWWSMVELNLYL